MVRLRTHFGTGVCHTDIATRVTLLRELTGEEVVEFGTEDTVSNKLSLFGDLARHFDEMGELREESECERAVQVVVLSRKIEVHPADSSH